MVKVKKKFLEPPFRKKVLPPLNFKIPRVPKFLPIPNSFHPKEPLKVFAFLPGLRIKVSFLNRNLNLGS